MSEEKKKKNKIIGISIGILVVLLIVVSSTYAYWQITKSQSDSNDIIAACLDIDMESVDGTFALNPAWPISDDEGKKLEGYTFKVTNNCSEDVNYIIGMDSLVKEGVEYLNYDSIKLSVDNNDPVIYGEQENTEHIEENDPYQIRDSKKLYTAVVKGKVGDEPGSNTHNIKVWIKAESELEDREKIFSGRMFITGGQKIDNDKPLAMPTPEECFEMSGNEIIDYKEENSKCGESVVIPATVNGTPVKTIDSNAFKNEIVEKDVIYYEYSSDEEDYVIVESLDTSLASVKLVLNNYEIGNDESFEKLEYIVVYENSESMQNLINYAFPQFEQQLGRAIPVYEIYNEGIEEPEILPGQTEAYFIVDAEGNMTIVGYKELKGDVMTELSVTDLDLSQAYNLEIIEAGAFSLLKIKEYEDEGCTELMLSVDDLANSSIPKGLTNLKFGTQEEIKIGYGAFAGLETDELTIYTNVKPYGVCHDMVSIPFLGVNVNTLNVMSTNTNTTLKLDTLLAPFTHSTLNNINISEGITEIGGYIFAGVNINSIILPNTLAKINSHAFATTVSKYAVPNKIVIPNNVTFIGDNAFSGWQNTNIIEFLRTQEVVEKTTTFESVDWAGNAFVKYAE